IVSRAVYGDAANKRHFGGEGGHAIARTTAVAASAGDIRDCPIRNFANAVVSRIGDVHIAGIVDSNASRLVELGIDRGSVVAGITADPSSCEDANRTIGKRKLIDAVLRSR